MNITVLNFKGMEFTGKWNGKTYASTIDGRKDLYRIYLGDTALHITKDALDRIFKECGIKQYDNLAQLQGTEKQIAYAEKIRLQSLRIVEKRFDEVKFDHENELMKRTDEKSIASENKLFSQQSDELEKLERAICEITDSKFFIENGSVEVVDLIDVEVNS